jgi:molecular chaperone GrpE
MSKEELNETVENQAEETQDTETEETVEVTDEEKFASLDEEFKAKMEAKVADAEARAKESEDKFLRTHADFENIKKRLEKEKYQAIDYASEKFAKDLLSTIDTLEMALQSANADIPAEELIEKLKEGIELTVKNVMTTFEKHDISVVETDEFDPQVHNAVMQVDSPDHESGQIVQVMQKGYNYKERLLRPAMVSIAN